MIKKQKILFFTLSLLLTILLLRSSLALFPHANFNVQMFNIHHLFTGAFFLVLAIIFFLFNIINKYTVLLAGISSGLILDELVYLIATDGSDLAYLTPISWWGMIIMVGIILLFVGGLYYGKKGSSKK